jgi:hypothetical protein
MAVLVGYRTWEEVTTIGTGSYSLGVTPHVDAVWGTFQLFSAEFSDNDQIYCAASDTGGLWEAGIYTYKTTGNLLERTTILASSNSDNAVSWIAGTKNIYSTILPNGIMLGSNNLSEITVAATARTNIGAMSTTGGTVTDDMTIQGNLTLNDTVAASLLKILGTGSAQIQIGRVDTTASTPSVDFHAGASPSANYDVRIICTAGTGTDAAGTAQILAALLQLGQSANDEVRIGEGNPATVKMIEGAATDSITDSRVEVYGPLNLDIDAQSRLVLPVGTNKWATT